MAYLSELDSLILAADLAHSLNKLIDILVHFRLLFLERLRAERWQEPFHFLAMLGWICFPSYALIRPAEVDKRRLWKIFQPLYL